MPRRRCGRRVTGGVDFTRVARARSVDAGHLGGMSRFAVRAGFDTEVRRSGGTVLTVADGGSRPAHDERGPNLFGVPRTSTGACVPSRALR